MLLFASDFFIFVTRKALESRSDGNVPAITRIHNVGEGEEKKLFDIGLKCSEFLAKDGDDHYTTYLKACFRRFGVNLKYVVAKHSYHWYKLAVHVED